MKFSYSHLPEQIQSDLKYIADFLLDESKVTNKSAHDRYTPSCIRHILLHGCFTEDHWTTETVLHPDEVSYRYNIMIIVSAHLDDLLPILKEAIVKLNLSGKVNFPVVAEIIDTKGRIDQKLRNGYLAYDQIQTRAILVYSRGDVTRDLFIPLDQPPADKHYHQAKDYYDHAFPLAELFFSGARSFEVKDRNAAAFMLNLATSQAYEAFMVVHILKYPLGRPLRDIRALAESIHPELSMIWTGLRGEQIFQILNTAFRDVRFSAGSNITEGELNLLFGYVKDLHKLIFHICQLKLDTLKAGSLEKPKQDWLEVVGEALKPPEDSLYGHGYGYDEEDEDDINLTPSDPSPIFRTAEQEEALEQLSSKIFELEEPCYDMEQLGNALTSMTHQDIDAELSGFPIMGRVVGERAQMLKDIFLQMVDLLKAIRLRGDDPDKGNIPKVKRLGV